MERDSDSPEPEMADVVYQFASMVSELVREVNTGRLTRMELVNLRASARYALVEVEREIQVVTPIGGNCTCPPVKWQIGSDVPTHMLRCPQFRSAQPRTEITACSAGCLAITGHCTACGEEPRTDVDSTGRCGRCQRDGNPAHTWCGTRP